MPGEDDKGAGAAGDSGAAGADPKPAVSFKTEGEFLAAVEKRSKGAISKAVDAAKAEILGALGIETLDDIGGVKERLASSEKTVSEAEKLKAAHDKLSKEIAKEQKRSGELSGRLIKIAKRDALLPFAGQVVDPEVLAMLVDPLLDVDEDGAVSVKNGTSLENVVGELLKARTYLKKPDAATGAGTGAKEPLKPNDGKGAPAKGDDKADDKGDGANGAPKYKTVGEGIVAQLKARGQLPVGGP